MVAGGRLYGGGHRKMAALPSMATMSTGGELDWFIAPGNACNAAIKANNEAIYKAITQYSVHY